MLRRDIDLASGELTGADVAAKLLGHGFGGDGGDDVDEDGADGGDDESVDSGNRSVVSGSVYVSDSSLGLFFFAHTASSL